MIETPPHPSLTRSESSQNLVPISPPSSTDALAYVSLPPYPPPPIPSRSIRERNRHYAPPPPFIEPIALSPMTRILMEESRKEQCDREALRNRNALLEGSIAKVLRHSKDVLALVSPINKENLPPNKKNAKLVEKLKKTIKELEEIQ